jgi:3-methyladenine DNA glycosylase AlkD
MVWGFELLSQDIHSVLRSLANPEKETSSARFFKTGPGQYGEGDQFLGISVPQQRVVAKEYYDKMELTEVEELLHSDIHEGRLTALIILTMKYKKGTDTERKAIYEIYMSNTQWVNSWDLVDASAELIVGPWLQGQDKKVLVKLAHSDLIWDRRIAMLATFHYIKQGDFEWALKIATILLNDKHDLIQKAVGWMLREIGKRSKGTATTFLDQHYKDMPRTMLRYAIERLPASEKATYMAKTAQS